jgi:hypothetical protein
MRNASEVKIVARLPWFVSSGNSDNIGAFIVAASAPESSGDDRSVLTLACDADVSRTRFSELAAQNDLDADTQAVADNPGDAGRRVHLVDVAGFVTADDPRVRGLATVLGDAEVSWLGAYAAPYVDNAENATERD